MNDVKLLLLLTPGIFSAEIPGVFRLFVVSNVRGGHLKEGREELEEGGGQAEMGGDRWRMDGDNV